MKFSFLSLGAAAAGILCVNDCFAQLQFDPVLPTLLPPTQLVTQANPSQTSEFPPVGTANDADPFNYFNGPVLPVKVMEEGANSPSSFTGNSDTAGIFDPASLEAEKSLPVSKSIAQQPVPEVIGSQAGCAPEVGMVPSCWSQGIYGCVTPNPIAGVMVRNWCTQGLWDTYPCQNARQCAHIQHQLAGHGINRYTGCGPACGGMVGKASCDCASPGTLPAIPQPTAAPLEPLQPVSMSLPPTAAPQPSLANRPSAPLR